MKNWMRESGGDAVRPAEQCEAELTEEEADHVNAYEARLQEITSELATEDEVDELLLQAKIEVARRNAIASHRGVPAGSPRKEGKSSARSPYRAALEVGVSLLGDILSLWLVFMVMFLVVAPHLNAVNDVAKVLLVTSSGVIAGAACSRLRRFLTRRASRGPAHPRIDPWWRDRMESLAAEVGSRKPSPIMRAIDIAFSVFAMTSMAVPMTIGYLILKSKGRDVLDRQPRVGQGGRVFMRYKFNVQTHESGDPATHSDLFLARSGIEQLPRLWNLFNGDLTLVGPKPENPALAIRYPRACRWVFEYRPGLTGPVSTELRTWLTMNRFDAETYLKGIVPLQSAYDRNYFGLSTTRQCCFMVKALVLLMVPLIIENTMLSGRPFTHHADNDKPTDPSPVPSMPADGDTPAAEHGRRVTKWSRHEYDHAFA
ncbi:sugar transferase [Streptomyces chartreusis]